MSGDHPCVPAVNMTLATYSQVTCCVELAGRVKLRLVKCARQIIAE